MYPIMINSDKLLCTDCINDTKMKPQSQEITQPDQHTPDGLRILARLIAREILFRRRTNKGKTPETKELQTDYREDIS